MYHLKIDKTVQFCGFYPFQDLKKNYKREQPMLILIS